MADMKWLQGLLVEIDKMTVLTDSDSEAESSQRELGELPEHLKKLFSYCMSLAVRLRDLRKEAKETDSRKAAGEIEGLVSRLNKRLTVATAIMWEEVHFEFKDQAGPDHEFSVCKGWKVYVKAKCDCLICRSTGGLSGLFESR